VDRCDGSGVEIVDEFCYPGDMLSVDGDADAAVTAGFTMSGLNLGQWSLSSLPKMFHCGCNERFMTCMYKVVCYTEVRRGH